MRRRSVTAALLLLGSLALTTVAAESHGHDQLLLVDGHSELATFSAGHTAPDQTSHIESATQLETSHCVGCLQRQRQRAVQSLAPRFGGVVPSLATIVPDAESLPSVLSSRLPSSRAPPRA